MSDNTPSFKVLCLERQLQLAINKVTLWCDFREFLFSAEETKVMVFRQRGGSGMVPLETTPIFGEWSSFLMLIYKPAIITCWISFNPLDFITWGSDCI